MPASLALLSMLANAQPGNPARRPRWLAQLLAWARQALRHPALVPSAATEAAGPPVDIAPATPAGPTPPPAIPAHYWTDQLWGKGFLMPGGTAEAKRLCGLLPLSNAVTLLMIGRDSGGVAAIAAARGSRISAHLDDPEVSLEMGTALARFGKRVTRAPWNPCNPAFRARYHDHALALEALRRCPPDRLLPALTAELKPAAQLVMLDMVSTAPARPGRDLDRWLELEGRAEPPPTEAEIGAALEAHRYNLHVVEDAGIRQGPAVLEAWAGLVGTMAAGPDRPSRTAARALVAEAEVWLLRQRLLQSGTIRLLRWHVSLR
ncbi:hypothetical protein [Roseomonas sp. WA12]